MDDSDRDYVDAPAEAVTSLCQACDGDGWVFASRMALVGGQVHAVAVREPCKVCRPDEQGAPSGRVNLGTGPGAKLKPWERVRIPGVDDWGPRRT